MSRYSITDALRARAVEVLHEIILHGSDRDRNAAIRNLISLERLNLDIDKSELLIARLDRIETELAEAGQVTPSARVAARTSRPTGPPPRPEWVPQTPNQVETKKWFDEQIAQRERWDAEAEAAARAAAGVTQYQGADGARSPAICEPEAAQLAPGTPSGTALAAPFQALEGNDNGLVPAPGPCEPVVACPVDPGAHRFDKTG